MSDPDKKFANKRDKPLYKTDQDGKTSVWNPGDGFTTRGDRFMTSVDLQEIQDYEDYY